MPSDISIAVRHLSEAAGQHAKQAKALQGLADQLKGAAAGTPRHFDTEAIAGLLLPLGLCLVHQDALRAALKAVQTVEPEDSHEGEQLAALERRLTLSLAGRAT